ncbi:MAG TPA: hypothetical protein VM734_30370 [Kofleriaceae bacterium]|nr:hypothetical protein [Kofleriaceae bacterium]
MRAVLLPTLLLAACVGQLEPGTGDGDGDGAGPDAGGDDPAAAAKASFDTNVKPLMEGFCRACHGGTDALGFLRAEPDVHTTVMMWPGLIDLDTPSSSRVLTKGAHDGPAWTVEQAATIRSWIDLEVVARAGDDEEEVIETPIIDPVAGLNTIPLDVIGLTGASVQFQAEKLSLGLYLSEIKVVAGTGGARVVHPLFVTWTDDVPRPDPVDSFEQLDLGVAAGQSAAVGGGLLMLVDVAPTARLSVHFRVAEPYAGMGGGGGGGQVGGCKAVPQFTTSARGPLATSCANCHAGGNAGATNATDMRQLNDMSATGQAGACGQILSRVNLANINTSGLFVAVDPAAGANHPFRFPNANAFNTFRTSVSTWIQAEVAAGQQQ